MLHKIFKTFLMIALVAGIVSLMMSCNKETPVSSSGNNVKDKKSNDPVPVFCVHVTDCETGYALSGAYVEISRLGKLFCKGYTNDNGDICFDMPDSFVPNGLWFNIFAQYEGYYTNMAYYVDPSAQIPIYIDICITMLGKK